MSYRNVCFTVNNYTEDERLGILNNERWSYVCCGKEVGEGGTPHLQGYGELKKRTRYNTVHTAIFGGRAHCEERRGKQEAAIGYTQKDGDFEERGERRAQGDRGDLDRVRVAAIDGGMRMVVRWGNLQQIKVAEKFLEYNEQHRDWKPEVWWIWGETGVGKSRRAREICGDDVYVKNTGSKWWSGYDAHEDVIIDDFRREWWTFEYLLALLDRYEMQIEVKGSQRQFLARRIIITCPWAPQHYFRGGFEDEAQLLRRIDHIVEIVPEVGVPEVG